MTNAEQDDKDVLAAEYVLGTLDADDRDNVRMLLGIDPSFAGRVRQWEDRLGQLHAIVQSVEPPAEGWNAIKAGIAGLAPSGQFWLPALERAAAPSDAFAAADASAASDTLVASDTSVASDASVASVTSVASETTVASDTTDGASRPAAPDESIRPPQAARTAELVALSTLSMRVTRWRRLAVGTGAMAAALAALMVLREVRPDTMPPALRPHERIVERVVDRVVEKPVEVVREVVRTVEVASPRMAEFVAVLQKDADSPAFLLTVDVDKRSFSVRRVGAEGQANKSYELWLVSSKYPAPRSLGVVGEEEFTVRRALSDYDAPTLNAATYAVSLEPQGGSPSGAPTGPVMFSGKLLQTTPAAFPNTTP